MLTSRLSLTGLDCQLSMKQRFKRDLSFSTRLCHNIIQCKNSHYDITESMVINETNETFIE